MVVVVVESAAAAEEGGVGRETLITAAAMARESKPSMCGRWVDICNQLGRQVRTTYLCKVGSFNHTLLPEDIE